MGIGSILPSVHKNQGWVGQYRRMIRWYNKFLATNPGDFEDPNIEDAHDTMFACFQNIFILKDWLHHGASIPKKVLNDYIEANVELKVCRDICNGTKHFNIKDASIDNDFTIIREFEPFHKALGRDKNKIIVLTGGHKFDLKSLAGTCIKLWEDFLRTQNLIIS